ncbi:MAG TPA: F0F1 ATP synthase subunit A [Candidatus Eisenbacteria bacterium]|jgi:F-type H+-transporting ATPase subunit a
MGLEFLARVRRTTGWVTGLAALWTATYASPSLGLAVLLGAAWSLVNLFLLEKLVVALTGPWRSERSARRRLTLAVAGMLALFVAGAGLLARVAPTGALVGFTIPMGVIVLKAAALLLLPSKLWKRVADATPRAVGLWVALLLVVVVGAGALVAHVTASGEDSASTPAVTAAPSAPTAGHGEPGEEGPQKFANLLTVLSRAFPEAPWARFLHHYEVVIFSLLVAFLVCLVAYLASRRAELIPKPFQNAVEAVVEALNDFIVGILGPRYGPRYVPFLGTLFIYILAMNLFGLIPFMDSPTSNLNVTVGLALVVFVYAQTIGIRELGVVGYIDHLAGNPRTAISWGLVPLMLPIHVMGELAKPISLSCRLFGNIFGEDMLLVAFVTLGITTLSFLHLPIGLPLQLPFLFLALLTSTLQALVFTVLSTIYFLLMLPHEEHGSEGGAQHAH